MAKNANSIVFGTGKIFSIPTTENPTPVAIGDVIDLMVDINQPLKTLVSDKQFPIAVARGPATINLKAKTAVFNGKVMRDLLFGVQKLNGQKKLFETNRQIMSGALVAATSTYELNFNREFVENLGVANVANKETLTFIGFSTAASPLVPNAGEYAINTEVAGSVKYIFSAMDAALFVRISFTELDATGSSFDIDNQIMGYQPVFSLVVSLPDPTDNTKFIYIKFHRVVGAKFSFGLSNEDFSKPDFEMQAFADEMDKVISVSTSEPPAALPPAPQP